MFTGRKLQPVELPYALQIDSGRNGTPHGSSTCLSMKKWVFSRVREESLFNDPQAVNLIYCQVRCWVRFMNKSVLLLFYWMAVLNVLSLVSYMSTFVIVI